MVLLRLARIWSNKVLIQKVSGILAVEEHAGDANTLTCAGHEVSNISSQSKDSWHSAS